MGNNKNGRNKSPMVASLSMTFKRATEVTEDVEEAKKEHRGNLKSLIDTYMMDVSTGKAEGIRTAKELVEVIKADLLLMGEATDRTDTGTSPVDEIRIQQLSKALDGNDPNVQSVIESIFNALNNANDIYGDGSGDYTGDTEVMTETIMPVEGAETPVE
jgi:hypothetical protein